MPLMNINQIFDKILIRSGQFVLRKENIEIDVDRFRTLVEDALELYSDSAPYAKTYTIDLRSGRSFTFTNDFDEELGITPDWLSQVHPIRTVGNVYAHYPSTAYGHGYGGRYQSEHLWEPIEAPWEFDDHTKKLNVSFSSIHKVVAVYRHFIREVGGIDGKVDYVLPTIKPRDQLFLDLVKAMFLEGIGRSRRAFTLNDLPILMDAAEIASEGKELKDSTIEKLTNYQKFYLSYGD